MKGFNSIKQAQRFLNVHPAVQNLINLGRHLMSARNSRNLRISALAQWQEVVA